MRARLMQLEGALLTARAESVLLRRLLARAEGLLDADLVTLREIEEACSKLGYEPDSGHPVALWIEAALTLARVRSTAAVTTPKFSGDTMSHRVKETLDYVKRTAYSVDHVEDWSEGGDNTALRLLAAEVARLSALDDRVRTTVDEACGLQPVMAADEALSLLESKLFEWRAAGERLRAENVELRETVEAAQRGICDLARILGAERDRALAELRWFKQMWPLAETIAKAFKAPPMAILRHIKALRAAMDANPKPSDGKPLPIEDGQL